MEYNCRYFPIYLKYYFINKSLLLVSLAFWWLNLFSNFKYHFMNKSLLSVSLAFWWLNIDCTKLVDRVYVDKQNLPLRVIRHNFNNQISLFLHHLLKKVHNISQQFQHQGNPSFSNSSCTLQNDFQQIQQQKDHYLPHFW